MPASTEERIDELEVKASFTEDTLESLNVVVIRQQEQIQALLREVAELRRLQAAAENQSAGVNQASEQPPHY